MNKLWIGMAAAATLVAGGAGVTAWTGPRVDDAVVARTAAALAGLPGVTVLDNRVERGFFESIHTVALSVGCPGGASPTAVGWRSRIWHGPLPGARGTGLARIDTSFSLPGGLPLTAQTRVAFGGAVVTELNSPGHRVVHPDHGTIAWKGLRATGWWDARRGLGEGLTYALSADEASVDLPGAAGLALNLGPAKASGQLAAAGAAPAWARPSNHTLRIERASVRGGPAAPLAAASAAEAGDPPAGAWNVLLDDVDLSLVTTLEQALWAGELRLATGAQADGLRVERLLLEASLRRLHWPSLDRALAPWTAAARCEAPVSAEPGPLTPDATLALVALLPHDPQVAIDRLAVRLGDSTAVASVSAALNGATAAELAAPGGTDPPQLLPKLQARAMAQADTAWLDELARRVPARWLPEPIGRQGLSDATRVSLLKAMIYGGVDAGLTHKVLRRNGDTVLAQATVEGGSLKVNGEPRDWRALMPD